MTEPMTDERLAYLKLHCEGSFADELLTEVTRLREQVKQLERLAVGIADRFDSQEAQLEAANALCEHLMPCTVPRCQKCYELVNAYRATQPKEARK